MANIEKVKQWLREGKKVRRPIWQEGSFWELSKDGYDRIVWTKGTSAKIHLRQLEDDDWEIYEKEFDLSEKINLAEFKDSYGYLIPAISAFAVKEFIKKRNELEADFIMGDLTLEEYTKKRDKLSGDKLIIKWI